MGEHICNLQFLIYFSLPDNKNLLLQNLDVHFLRVTKMLSSSTILCTILDLNVEEMSSSSNPTPLVLQMHNSEQDLSICTSHWACRCFWLDCVTTDVIKTFSFGYLRLYYEGTNLFEEEKVMSMDQKYQIVKQLVDYTKQYPKGLNPLIYPQNIIINSQKAVVCAKVRGGEHKSTKINAAFSCPASIQSNSNFAVKYCLANVIFFLLSGKIPYISSKNNITTEGFK